MIYHSIVSQNDVAAHFDDPQWVFIDCRFSLADTDRGQAAYQQSHIPGAVYAHLDHDLSGTVIPGETGRHPWPSPEAFAATCSAWGIDGASQVVAYDDFGGAIAARLWALLRWLGHEAVAVLDGGWPRWDAEGRPVRGGTEHRAPRAFIPHPDPALLVSTEEVAGRAPDILLLDARAHERYLGLVEPIDPVAGHIPGAYSAPFGENLDEHGCFLPPDQLRDRFDSVLRDTPVEKVICYCGSGVTANHNRLAMAYAGMGLPMLYPGSWSEWITSRERPMVTGDHDTESLVLPD